MKKSDNPVYIVQNNYKGSYNYIIFKLNRAVTSYYIEFDRRN